MYAKHLFDSTTDGYIHLIKLENNKQVKIYNTTNKALKEVIEEFKGEENIYIGPNTFFIPKRENKNIRQFRALYIDLDNLEDDQVATTYRILELAEENIIPKPTMIVDSGRGLHLYWRIKNAPYRALHTWQELEDMLYHRLKKYGADIKATDGARVLRLPGTINSKNKAECRIIYQDNNLEYSMYDLRETYLQEKYKKQISKAYKNNKVIKNAFYNSYSLHIARAEDLEMLCKLRNYDVKGYRNMIIHCYTYWNGIYERDLEVLENKVKELNNSFIKPLRNSEIKATIKSVNKAIDKFIKYEQGIRAGEDRRVTKGMKDKGGYWYKNETLIERLGITDSEQRQMKTIIGTRVKYDRKNEKRNLARRNENGLTPKQQELQDLKIKILELKEQGLSIRKIAEILGKSKGSIENVLKK